jgi:DNA transformation protein
MRPLGNSDAFIAFALDQLSDFGEVTAKSMFGGVGLYHRGIFFGIVAGDTLYFKTDEFNRRDYKKRRMKPFAPYQNMSTKRSSYYAVPLSVLESALTLSEWARAAVLAAGRHRR